MSLSFSARARLKGMLAPSSITIERPRVQITASYGLIGSEDETDAADADTAGADENGAAGAGEAGAGGKAVMRGGKAVMRGGKAVMRGGNALAADTGEKKGGKKIGDAGGKAGGRIRTGRDGKPLSPEALQERRERRRAARGGPANGISYTRCRAGPASHERTASRLRTLRADRRPHGRASAKPARRGGAIRL